MMEYVLAMATSDVESRPKGGWKEYEMGEHVKPGLHGRKRGDGRQRTGRRACGRHRRSLAWRSLGSHAQLRGGAGRDAGQH